MPNNVCIDNMLFRQLNLRHNSKIFALFKTASCSLKMVSACLYIRLNLVKNSKAFELQDLQLIYLFTQNPFNEMDASTFDIMSLKLCHDRYDIRMIFRVDL